MLLPAGLTSSTHADWANNDKEKEDLHTGTARTAERTEMKRRAFVKSLSQEEIGGTSPHVQGNQKRTTRKEGEENVVKQSHVRRANGT